MVHLLAMSSPLPIVGSISWTDLTVPDATALSQFYSAVVGWKSAPLDMGGYADFCMQTPSTDATVAGICHARGDNVDLPAQWLIYINVADLDASLRRCKKNFGRVLTRIKISGQGRFAVIQDPAGAVAALFEPAQPKPKKSAPKRRAPRKKAS